MIAGVRRWYGDRNRREKRLLLLMLAIALPILGWLCVALLNDAYASALREHLEAVDRNGRVRALAVAARTQPSTNPRPGPTVDLALVVTESAAQSGVTLQGTTPSGPNSLDVQVSGAPATAVAQWLRVLDARGIAVDEMRMSPTGDRLIAMSARLVRRG